MKLRGYCPMGCGATLGIADALPGRESVICTNIQCPNPWAVNSILSDPETEHLVRFGQDGWKIIHPLRERLGYLLLLECDLHRYLSYDPDHDRSQPDGTYRATEVTGPGTEGRWAFEEVPES